MDHAKCIIQGLASVPFTADQGLSSLLLTVRYKLASFLPAEVIKDCKVALDFSDRFEHDISAALGFTDSRHPELDLEFVGPLGLLMAARFIERTDAIYDEVKGVAKVAPNLFLTNLVRVSQDTTFGFPLISVLMDIAGKCISLTRELPRSK